MSQQDGLPPLPTGATPLPPLPAGASMLPSSDDSSTPPLPAGATALPPLPAGATPLDNGPSAKPYKEPSMAERIFDTAGATGGITGLATGAVRGALGTLSGATKLSEKALPIAMMGMNAEDKARTQKFLDKVSEIAEGGVSPEEEAGKVTEGIAEFLMGDAALKGMSYAERLQKILPLAKQLEKWAPLRKVMASAITQGTLFGGQTAVKTGGDVGKTVAAGATGAVLGAVPEAIAGTAGSVINRMQKPARDAAQLLEENRQGIQQAAQNTASRTLQEVNESRAVQPINPARTLTSDTGPFEFEIQGVPAAETTEGSSALRAAEFPHENTPVSQQSRRELGSTAETIPPRMLEHDPAYMTGTAEGEIPQTTTIGGGGTLRTNNPEVMRDHIASLNDEINSPDFANRPLQQQQEILANRTSSIQQMDRYHDSIMQQTAHNRPNFEPINIRDAVQRTTSFPEAVDRINEAHKEVYQRLDDLTGNEFQALRNSQKAAWQSMIDADTESLPAAERNMARVNGQMEAMFRKLRGAVSESDLAGANQAYKNGLIAEKVSNVVENSLSGTWKDTDRVLDGGKLINGLKRLYQSEGTGTAGQRAVARVIGQDTIDNLENIAKRNMTPADQQKNARFLRHIVASLAGGFGFKAAALLHTPIGPAIGVGGAAYYTTEMLLNKMASDPRIGNMIMYAIEKTNRSSKAIMPVISSVLSDALTKDDQWQQAQDGHAQDQSPDEAQVQTGTNQGRQ
jgi:hypothetical protein